MRKFLMCMAAIGLALGMSSSAQASHIFAKNGKINGVALGAGNLPTNPTINATAGSPVTFSFEVFSISGDPDTFRVTFVSRNGPGFPDKLPSTPGQIFAYNGSGTVGSPVLFSFTRSFSTPGLYRGYITPNLLSSFPDYRYPGGLDVTFGTNPKADPDFPDGPGLPFTLNVGPVPEPTSMALLATGAAGLFGSRFVRRRKNEKV